MTITVTPEPLNAPPRNVVEVSVPAGSVMSSVAVWRNDLNGRTLLRSQPAAGFDSRTVFDYESPYGTSVTYDWAALYTDPTAFVTVLNETWANTAAWTVQSGSFNVSAGKLRNSVNYAGLTKSFSSLKRRVTFASLASATGYTRVYLTAPVMFGPQVVLRIEAGVLSLNDTITTINPTLPFKIDFNSSNVTLTGTGGSATASGNFLHSRIAFEVVDVNPNDLNVGAILVQDYGAEMSIAETSSADTLSPVDAWLVNVATPSLSFPLTGSNPFKAGIDFIGSVTNPTNTTRHQILGSDRVLPVTTGPRGDDETQMGIYTATNAERVALRALLKPDIPILVNIPANWDYDFESGFYSVGDVESDRQADPRHKAHMRRTTLPMVRVSSPVVTVENSGWSYAAVAVEFATYTSLPMSFDTYADLASNTRS